MDKRKLNERPDSLNRAGRPRGVPPGKRNKLTVEGKEPGFSYCWVNDDNVPDYLLLGYEFVTHNVTVGNRKVDSSLGQSSHVTIPVGNGVTGHLMRIPEELRNEAMQVLDQQTDEGEDQMFQGLNSRKDGRYGEVKKTNTLS